MMSVNPRTVGWYSLPALCGEHDGARPPFSVRNHPVRPWPELPCIVCGFLTVYRGLSPDWVTVKVGGVDVSDQVSAFEVRSPIVHDWLCAEKIEDDAREAEMADWEAHQEHDNE